VKPRARTRYHHGDLARALTAAAVELVATHGPTGFTLREAARRAGVTHTAPYRHFASRTALLAAVAEEGFRGMHAAMTHAMAHAGADPLARLQAVGVAYVRYAVDHPSHFQVMFGAEVPDKLSYPALAAAAGATGQLLIDGITACQARGLVRAGAAADLTLPLWSIVHGLAALLIEGQTPLAGGAPGSVTDQARAVTTAILDGLGGSRLDQKITAP
jgi:AcrR family transcriptional regulator